MAFTDTHWDKVLQAFNLKAQASPVILNARGIPDMHSIFVLVRENWDLFADEKALDAYIKAQLIAQKTAEKAVKEAEAAELDAEIKALER